MNVPEDKICELTKRMQTFFEIGVGLGESVGILKRYPNVHVCSGPAEVKTIYPILFQAILTFVNHFNRPYDP